MDKAALLALADRVERFDTSGPYDIARERERELNEAIAIAVGLPATVKVGHAVLGNERAVPSRIPAYTASIDAAMTLVPSWACPRIFHNQDMLWECRLENGLGIPFKDYAGLAQTICLAVLSAALRARANQ